MVLLNIKVLICWHCKIFFKSQILPSRLSLFDTVRKILSSCGNPLPGNNPSAETLSARELNIMQRGLGVFFVWGFFRGLGDFGFFCGVLFGWSCFYFCSVLFGFLTPQIPHSWLPSLSLGIITQLALSITVSEKILYVSGQHVFSLVCLWYYNWCLVLSV